MLIVPNGQDQPDNARRCVELGVGEVLTTKDYTVEKRAARLQQLLSNPSYAEAARNVAAVVQSEDGTKTACDIIEAALGGRPSFDRAAVTEPDLRYRTTLAGCLRSSAPPVVPAPEAPPVVPAPEAPPVVPAPEARP